MSLSTGGVGVGGIQQSATSGVDLVDEVVNMAQEKNLYTANAAVIKTADKMLGTLLDVFDNADDEKKNRQN